MSVVQSGDIHVEPEGLLASLATRWRRIAFVAVAATGLALTLAWLSTPLYKGETRILIETPGVSPSDHMNGQIELIRSADLLERVAATLGLSRLPEFDEAAEPSFASQALIATGLRRDPNETPAEARILRAMRAKLDVYGAESSRVIVIEFSSSDRQLAADVPNAIADAYVSARFNSARTPDVVAQDSAGLAERVRDAEARLAEFRARSEAGAGDELSARANLMAELTQIRAERRASEATAQSLQNVIGGGGSIEALPDDLSLAGLSPLLERQAQLEAETSELSLTLLDNHPRMKAARAQLAETQAQIRAEARLALDATAASIDAAQARENELAGELERLEPPSAGTDGQGAELLALEAEAERLRGLLASSPSGVGPVSDGAAADARIFARAIAPSEPYFPRFGPIAGAAFAGSLALMIAITLLGASFSRRSRPAADHATPEPIREIAMPHRADTAVDGEPQRIDAIALYGQTSELEPVVQDVAPMDEPHAFGEEFYEFGETEDGSILGEIGVESAAERLIAGCVTRAIFVSPEGDEAAAAAVLVAREIADAGLRVLLLDLTASGAASRPMLDSLSYPGITNLMAAEAQFTDVIHADHYSACHVMPVGTADPARAMRAADRLPIIMDSLTTAYDVVIVECGPAGAEAIRRLAAPGAEILVSVIEPDEEVAAAADALVAGGYGQLTLVTPAGYRSPSAPLPGRSAA